MVGQLTGQLPHALQNRWCAAMVTETSYGITMSRFDSWLHLPFILCPNAYIILLQWLSTNLAMGIMLPSSEDYCENWTGKLYKLSYSKHLTDVFGLFWLLQASLAPLRSTIPGQCPEFHDLHHIFTAIKIYATQLGFFRIKEKQKHASSVLFPAVAPIFLSPLIMLIWILLLSPAEAQWHLILCTSQSTSAALW